jgi:copper chaperone CopZ
MDVPTGQSARITIKVSGMTCRGCAEGLKRALERTPGVESADVRFERSDAVVEYNTARVTLDQITETIRQAGYKPSL